MAIKKAKESSLRERLLGPTEEAANCFTTIVDKLCAITPQEKPAFGK
jgi:hypothetical protein